MQRRVVWSLAIGMGMVAAVGCASSRPPVEDIGEADASTAVFSHTVDDGDGGSTTANVSANELPDSGACSCTEHTGGATWGWPCNYTLCFPWQSYSCVANDVIVTDLGCNPTPEQLDAAASTHR